MSKWDNCNQQLKREVVYFIDFLPTLPLKQAALQDFNILAKDKLLAGNLKIS